MPMKCVVCGQQTDAEARLEKVTGLLAKVRECIGEDDTFLGAVLRVEIDKALRGGAGRRAGFRVPDAKKP